MFRHHERMQAMGSALHAGVLGPAGPRHVSSGFSFRGDADFFVENIRCKIDGDPLGCLGDLGWYNVGLSLWAFGYEPPARASATVIVQTDEGVPLHVSCTLVWPEDDHNKASFEAPRTATFFCSFLHVEQQWAHIAGTSKVLEIEDFVIPFSPASAKFSLKKHVWGDNALSIDNQVEVHETPPGPPQEVRMWREFAAEVAAVDSERSLRRSVSKTIAP